MANPYFKKKSKKQNLAGSGFSAVVPVDISKALGSPSTEEEGEDP